MMNSKYIVLILLIYSPGLFSQQTLQEQYEYALSLYRSEKYFDAVTESERLIYFDKGKEYAFKSNLLIGKAYKEGGKFSEALMYFSLAEMHIANDSELFDARINAVRINILRRTTNAAQLLLDRLERDRRFIYRMNEIRYWRGWTYIFADEWDEASKVFEEIKNDTLKVLCEKVSEEKYNVTTAKILSFIIPGAGQFYTGHYFSGILSLGWNVFWGYLTVKAFVDERIFDGFITGNFLLLRFYSGNIQNADRFAEEENQSVENKALEYLQYRYSGEKP